MQARQCGVPGVLAVLVIITIVLTLAAAGAGVLPGDVAVAHVVQAVPFAGAELLAWFAFWTGSAPVVFIVNMVWKLPSGGGTGCTPVR